MSGSSYQEIYVSQLIQSNPPDKESTMQEYFVEQRHKNGKLLE